MINAAIVKKALLQLFQCYAIAKMQPFSNLLSFCAVYEVFKHLKAHIIHFLIVQFLQNSVKTVSRGEFVVAISFS